MENMTKCLLSMLAGALLALAALFGVRQCTERHNPDTEPVVIRDTTIVHDTIRMDNPVPTYIRTTDTIRLKIPVTEVLRDTVYVSLPREEKTYRDTNYTAIISGYEPRLDYMEVYPKTITITETVTERTKRRPWGIGVNVGYGATLHDRQVMLSPYIGIGVSYNFLTF